MRHPPTHKQHTNTLTTQTHKQYNKTKTATNSDWYLAGRAALYRQTVVTSSFASPDLLGLLSKRCSSHAGRARLLADPAGVLAAAAPRRLRQAFSRFEAASAAAAAEARLERFKADVWPRLQERAAGGGGALLFVPQYFDFVRVSPGVEAEGSLRVCFPCVVYCLVSVSHPVWPLLPGGLPHSTQKACRTVTPPTNHNHNHHPNNNQTTTNQPKPQSNPGPQLPQSRGRRLCRRVGVHALRPGGWVMGEKEGGAEREGL